MIELTDAFILEKNKLENKPIYLYEVEDFDGLGNSLLFAAYDQDISFNGKTYIRFPISHDGAGENTSGEIDAIVVKVANVSQFIQAKLEAYNLRGKKVIITMVFANLLSESLNKLEQIYYIDSYSSGMDVAEFSCTSKFDLMKLELPARKYWRNFCAWKFKSAECAYSGDQTTCNKTFQRCKALSNQVRFGGFPSIPSRHIYVG
ncbi:MAG: DUF2163 domain-containing protein [Verrucomicrobiae bacterium]|nr:DUF2163 domain-containing protein [Verrucomicrobiae bacterium]